MLRSVLLVGLAMVASVLGNDIEIHGSGTTNPSKCYWHIMDAIKDRLRVPVRMTYRAVGSGVGQKEFMGEAPEFMQINHFGSGDIPLSTENYNLITGGDDPSEMLHLPVVLGAITYFHSIPGVPSGAGGLNMTSCLLARIFSRDIKDWLHEDITKGNPNLADMIGDKDSKITVIRRKKGSSSTASITKYMNAGCSGEWKSDMVGKDPQNWHSDLIPCEGSGGVTKCIKENAGAIGYIDSGHGLAQGLAEIELKNADDIYVNTATAKNGGIGDAAANAVGLPSGPDGDWGKIDLINQKGPDTWPVTALSYIYVRKDWTKLGLTFEQQGLLFAFLKSLYREEYIEVCEEEFGFVAASSNMKLKKLASDGLDMIVGATENGVSFKDLFTFEQDTQEYIGQDNYVISQKRRSYAEYQRSQLQLQVDQIADVQKVFDADVSDMSRMMSENPKQLENSNETQVMAALIMSGVSLVLWFLFVVKTLFFSSPKEEAAAARPAPATNGSYSNGASNGQRTSSTNGKAPKRVVKKEGYAESDDEMV